MATTFTIHSSASPAERSSLEVIETAAQEHPVFLAQTMIMYGKAPEAIGEVLDFLQEHPEGMGTLMAWRHVVREKLDALIEFDDETEEAIAEDSYFKSTKAAFDKTQGDEKLRNQLRVRKLNIFAKRLVEDTAA